MNHYIYKVYIRAGKFEDHKAAMAHIEDALSRLVDDEWIGDYEVLAMYEDEYKEFD